MGGGCKMEGGMEGEKGIGTAVFCGGSQVGDDMVGIRWGGGTRKGVGAGWGGGC